MTPYENFKSEACNLRKKYATEELQILTLARNIKTEQTFFDGAMSPKNAAKTMAMGIYCVSKGNINMQVEILKAMQTSLESLNEANLSPRNIAIITGTEPLKMIYDVD